MNTEGTPTGQCRARSILCTVAMVFGILTIVAISTALAIRLLEMGEPKDAQDSLLGFLHLNDAAIEADKAQRQLLWILAFVNLGLAIASTALAVAASRTHSLTIMMLLLIFGIGTTVVGFYLVWPLGALAAVVPICAAIGLPMSRASCTMNT
ncbi:MAG: hypothetical protein CMJ29_13405 [Phycisphaerae bacterium]|nr:hypothetical protein [Phycisphaerae bacterium]